MRSAGERIDATPGSFHQCVGRVQYRTRTLDEIPAHRGQSNTVSIALKYCDGQYTLDLGNL